MVSSRDWYPRNLSSVSSDVCRLSVLNVSYSHVLSSMDPPIAQPNFSMYSHSTTGYESLLLRSFLCNCIPLPFRQTDPIKATVKCPTANITASATAAAVQSGHSPALRPAHLRAHLPTPCKYGIPTEPPSQPSRATKSSSAQMATQPAPSSTT